MDFKYVRIQGRELASNTMHPAGIFSICRKLMQDGVLVGEDADLFMEIEEWFVENLPFPDPCMRKEHVVCFFKTSNAELMLKMITPVMWLLDRCHHPFYVVYTNDPGEIVYEDEYQVAVKIPETVVTEFHHDWVEPGSGIFSRKTLDEGDAGNE